MDRDQKGEKNLFCNLKAPLVSLKESRNTRDERLRNTMKNNRTNEEDLREGLAEKARLAQEEMAQDKVREAEEEERHGEHKK